MKTVEILKEFVDANNFAKNYEVGEVVSFEDERAEHIVSRGFAKFVKSTGGGNDGGNKSGSGSGNPELTLEKVVTLALAKIYLRGKGIEIANSAPLKKVIEVASLNGIVFPNLPVSNE